MLDIGSVTFGVHKVALEKSVLLRNTYFALPQVRAAVFEGVVQFYV